MTTFMIIHGAYGHPEENWFPWLKSELEKAGHEVIVPLFPTPDNQSLESWTDVMKEYKIDENTVFVGHSLGPAFILSILEKHKARAAFFVAGFISPLGHDEFDPINRTFTERDFDWEKIQKNCRHFCIISSDNDPYVSMVKGAQIAEKLNSELIIIKHGGHLNKDSGYAEFPLLLEKIRMVM